MNKAELVLLYHFIDQEKADKIKLVLAGKKIAVKEVPDAMIGQRIGYLLGLNGFSENKAAFEAVAFEEEVMVLQNVSRKRLDELLAAFQDAGVGKIHYKAIVTPYNLLWTLRRLCETMRKEHQGMAVHK